MKRREGGELDGRFVETPFLENAALLLRDAASWRSIRISLARKSDKFDTEGE